MHFTLEHSPFLKIVFLRKVLFVLSVLSLQMMPLLAQTSASLEQADQLYQQYGYHAAATLYEQVDADLAALERLANSYRLNHDTENAEVQYAKLVEQSDNPLHFLRYAQVLHSNGKLDMAKTFYLKYDAAVSDKNDQRGKQIAHTINQLSTLKSADVLFENAAAINSDKSDFSPVFYKNGIVFVSTRSTDQHLKSSVLQKDKWTGDDYSALYSADFQEDGTIATPELFATGLDAKFHEGPLTFSRNGDLLLYTRNVSKQKKQGNKEYFLKIATAIRLGNKWLKDDPFDLGDWACNDVHPTLSADGQQLVFASDRPGGYGGMDLYLTTFSNGHWGVPINLGPTINTPGQEVFPFLYDDGTLYFASDGWGGFGGLDIFHSQLDEMEDWEQATNLGSPFNSNKDDFGYLLNVTGTEGYLSSAREGGLGKDDLYHFLLPKPQSNKLNHFPNTTLCVIDESDGRPIAGASIAVFTKNKMGEYQGYENENLVKLVIAEGANEFEKQALPVEPFAPTEPFNREIATTPNGSVQLYFAANNDYLIQVKMNGYEEAYRFFDTKNMDQCIALKPAHFTYLKGQVVDNLTGKPIAAADLTLLNLKTMEEKNGSTDEEGGYQFCLEKGADFIIKASKDNFGEDNALVSTFQLEGKSGLVHRDLQLNATSNTGTEDKSVVESGFLIELEQIYYNYGTANIRPDAAKELDQIALFLQRNANLSIELRSHTDSRGEAAYNKELSQQRAKAAADYLIQKGVSSDRVTAIGMGEEHLLNGCEDGKECSEAEHQVNRRTEVRFY